jgi:hypothetical protein
MRVVGRWRSRLTMARLVRSRRAISASRPCPELSDLLGADRLEVLPQVADGRAGIERLLPGLVALDLLGDDRLDPGDVAPPALEILLHDRLERAHVVHEHAVEVVDRRVDVARHGDVDEDEGGGRGAPWRRRRARGG